MKATKKTIEEFKEEIRKETDKIRLEEPIDVKKTRLGLYSGAGPHNQYFSVYELSLFFLSYLNLFVIPTILRLSKDQNFELYHLKSITTGILKDTMFCHGYLGWRKLGEFNARFIDMLDDLNEEDFIDLMKLLSVYMRQYHSWLYHYNAWGIGSMFFPKRSEKDIKEMLELLNA